MELTPYFKRISELVKKYKYVAIMIAVGLFFMLLPVHKNTDTDKQISITSDSVQTESLEDKLIQTLSQIKGVGKVKVLLSIAKGEQIMYQTNESLGIDSDSEKEDIDTVIITDSERNQNGLIHQINPPSYMGAIIVCQGADDPAVKLSITEAVSKITGLKTNRISVLRMK